MYLNLTQIKEHFGLNLPAEFIVDTLKVPNDSSDKKAKFWLPQRVTDIAQALSVYALERGAVPAVGTSVPKTAAAPAAAPAAPVAEDNSDLF